MCSHLSLLPLACDEVHGMCMKCTAYILAYRQQQKVREGREPKLQRGESRNNSKGLRV
ncbi:hypothetical protein RchiOBHm_Chr2g0157301 [Rosa chinensis]|uniref:Uncharacterized protein n=1 Tax=Rosa chinensis TaxID=74649 RepID=A0A2P6S1Q1_ROSCH|nr:hypothetical protein RchiOBHm_Chr2g0157301 [Rosa chinensis]